MFILGLCEIPNPFSFISESPYEALWPVMVLCGVLLLALFVMLWVRSSPRALLMSTAIASGVAFALAIVDGRQATIGLVCAGFPGASTSAQQTANASLNILSMLQIVAGIVLLFTIFLLIIGSRSVIKGSRASVVTTPQ